MKVHSISDQLVLNERRVIRGAPMANWWRRLRAGWERIALMGRVAPRRLRLCESLPLGERRFVAVVEFESSRFLLGGTSTSLVLLAQIGDAAGERSRVAADARGGDSDEPPAFAADFDRPNFGGGGE